MPIGSEIAYTDEIIDIWQYLIPSCRRYNIKNKKIYTASTDVHTLSILPFRQKGRKC